ncbi:MAG: deoxyribodipyrimidine photolyase [Phycisphaera sp.]|nr:deoxyribodipyrimidine photolyase [Phycisphaera sp.]
MSSSDIQTSRIRRLNDAEPRAGRYVLYWMQASQRAVFNHALEHAVREANAMGLPLVCAFALVGDYPDSNRRHKAFMLEGLRDAAAALERRGVRMVIRRGAPVEVIPQIAQDASLVVTDRGYLRHQVVWRHAVATAIDCPMVQVETDVVVPVETASNKAEYAARTIRPKLMKRLDEYLVELKATPVKHDALGIDIESMDIGDTAAVLEKLGVSDAAEPVPQHFRGGTAEAMKKLRELVEDKLDRYAANRNQPQTDDVSYMSMYLHYGQISPVAVAMEVRNAKRGTAEDREVFIEELVVRRELGFNFVRFTPEYDRFACLPRWAQATLKQQTPDEREHVYTATQLADAETHDRYWNAAMNEMRHTGYMHNYMRMYWGKKILEWTNTPQHAYRVTLELNNRYFIDGRDPVSYANVGWVYGLHDRPWTRRPIFGTVRYMAASGLERKCDIDGYVEKVAKLMTKKAT